MVTLVTGATGLVGNNVARLLVSRGQRVRVLAREAADPRPLAELDLEIARGDVRDRAAVERAILLFALYAWRGAGRRDPASTQQRRPTLLVPASGSIPGSRLLPAAIAPTNTTIWQPLCHRLDGHRHDRRFV